jgi:hypothetical protein
MATGAATPLPGAGGGVVDASVMRWHGRSK